MTQEEIDQIEISLNKAFRPHSPIEDPSYFFGRSEEKASLRRTVFASGQHAVIYGEKGAGKTSLARVSVAGSNRVNVFCEKDSTFSKVMRDLVNELRGNEWAELVFDYNGESVSVAGSMVSLDNLTGNAVKRLLADKNLVVILDEIDRLPSETLRELGEFVKNVATDCPMVTIFLVGASDNEDDILKGHGSVYRNTKFIRLEKFKDITAVREIANKGGEDLVLTFSDDAVSEIGHISDLYPYYVQLLCVSAARQALLSSSDTIKPSHVLEGAQIAANEADNASLRDLYDASVLSAKSDVYKNIIWGLAKLDSSDELAIGAVAIAANSVSSKPISPQSAGASMVRLAQGENSILKARELGTKKTFYSFRHPLMKSYVRIRMLLAN
ncbi:AAA family ATPase [Gluconobacter cerinus]|uniref:AAA family ATPase n=1 Tax=Gluconobacter cerinus TaxID=38307 RepID=UPI001C0566C6|nr:AAA family ATPase [Gluconobacter cerinus]